MKDYEKKKKERLQRKAESLGKAAQLQYIRSPTEQQVKDRNPVESQPEFAQTAPKGKGTNGLRMPASPQRMQTRTMRYPFYHQNGKVKKQALPTMSGESWENGDPRALGVNEELVQAFWKAGHKAACIQGMCKAQDPATPLEGKSSPTSESELPSAGTRQFMMALFVVEGSGSQPRNIKGDKGVLWKFEATELMYLQTNTVLS